ncbi:MAG: hypothetical protein JOY62_10210 [Acidobacteriaceae bacterium]|nr:hypothetical protein [Acidobacteriaceae bacterium]
MNLVLTLRQLVFSVNFCVFFAILREHSSMGKKHKITRRTLLGASTAAVAAGVGIPAHRWDNFDFGCAHATSDRLDQGPFDIDQDEGWRTLITTTPSSVPVRNYGLGLVGYTWEENGPSIPVRKGSEKLEDAVEKIATLPFVDVLYIRCDWRDVQSKPGRLDLNPVWDLTMDAAKRHGLRFAFRIQLSNPEFQAEEIALPNFLRDKIPLVKIGHKPRHGREIEFVEPRYDHPAFQTAFQELNQLLAARFDGDPLLEWMDLMQYGFWGEGHTNDLPNPFPDYLTAERTFLAMTKFQLETWKRTPLAVNTQPDISNVGNSEILDLAVRSGCWLRSDSIINEEPIQIEELANRPPWLPVIMEDGDLREYDITRIPVDAAGVNLRENAMLHVLDLGANYWSLWTEAENLARYNERFPNGFRTLRAKMGYRVRPAWVWQRKRLGACELIVAVANDGVAGIPGVLRLTVTSADGKLHQSGSLDGGHPHAGKVRQASFLFPRESFGSEVTLRVEIESKAGIRRPIQWACAQPLNQDGSLSLQLRKWDDPGWLKGV